VLLGTFLFCLNYILAYRAQIHLTSALAAIAFSTMLWMNIILSRLVFGTRAGRRVLIGALLGIIGIVVLFAPLVGEVSLSDGVFYGSVLALLGALMSSIGNMVSQGAQNRSLPTAILSMFRGHPFTFDGTFTYIVSLVYLAIFGSVVAFGAYLTLLGRIGAHKAGYASVMFPVVALILSMSFEGLRLDVTIVLGASLVILGNVMVLKEER
jgi:drug/metabolite transporter (DMT)-like permease